MDSSITYILLAVVLVIGIFVMVKKFINKRKQKDNFNSFIKPKVKETLKFDGYANHSYEIIHRYHHPLTSQNRVGQVDIILRVYNPKIGDSSSVNVAYTLMMKEVAVNKKEFVWDIETIQRTEVEKIEKLLVEKKDRKKHKVKYFKKDVKSKLGNTKNKVKDIKNIFKPKVTSKEEEKKDKIEDKKVSDPFEVL